MNIASSDSVVGSVLGSFRIVKPLGRGGMGSVYLAEHTVIGSKVAIKVLHDRLAVDEGLVARFYAEARAVNMIGHENIVSIFDMNVVPPHRYYLVMEYLDGKPLNSLLRRPVPIETAIPILTQVCEALQAAHDVGIVHRDLKPENIFLIKRGKQDNFIKVLDFGLAKLLEPDMSTTNTAVGLIVGTPEFMSPEQANSQPVDGRADIYALGCIAWLLVTARLPYPQKGLADLIVAHRSITPTAPHLVNPSVPPELSRIIMKAMAKKPEERYQSAKDFGQALEKILTYDVTPTPMHGANVTPTPAGDAAGPNRQPRFEAHLEADLTTVDGLSLGKVQLHDISKGGAFIDLPGALPPLFARVKIDLLHQKMALMGEVVRHVTTDQAKAWGMSPGVGVQFIDLTPAMREQIGRLTSGLPVRSSTSRTTSLADDPAASVVLERHAERVAGDHYEVLGTAPESSMDDLRLKVRETQRELEGLKERPLSENQDKQLEASLARVKTAYDVLCTPVARAEYDSNRGNFRGVARCIQAGLLVTDLERLRAAHLERRTGIGGSAHVKFLASKALEAKGQLQAALEACENALELDPLNLPLHHRHAMLLRKLQGAGGT